ncbi:hypothetical protein CABS01_01670 [Colletotrichum abscissum]|uniref:Uncharacterized protein n=3 Tax=Colletotrichum acutatum species complex TaxID=2707335 RepID=A0A9Q0AYA1_9PEZI|nr:uncharacterized protein CLUP02_10341 [Colletotrichum lupini]XP_060316082.1 uncharacterized protein CCOS01_06139 [Colletotrichum costaricense]XP_060398239.1 uncharacterized protein CABS01_01670 [Colletotrichum abscissum]KAI3546028.1 hypothetical protein CSPX01_04524 [Colletotrichum filicis]KAI3537927.1 hypothetical protein CABS02_11932 [Colletotrichum abscissum]KAK1495863.1 hypothetical protein CABS01_01670 [Colletotrichum abscissum]KAK1531036.1 hypothetical protein CCOS01_06139 [Colletotri
MPRIRTSAVCTCLTAADPMMPYTSEGSAVEAALTIRSGASLLAGPSCSHAGTMLESECGETWPGHDSDPNGELNETTTLKPRVRK